MSKKGAITLLSSKAAQFGRTQCNNGVANDCEVSHLGENDENDECICDSDENVGDKGDGDFDEDCG